METETETPLPMNLPPELAKYGYHLVDGDIIPRVVACTHGQEKSGKNTWALSAPGPIVVIGLDANTEVSCARAARGGKEIILLDKFKPPKEIKGKTDLQARAKKVLGELEAAVAAIVKHALPRTLFIDTGTELYELVRLALLGKLTKVMPHNYAEVNTYMRVFLQDLMENEKLNIIITHKVKKEYGTMTDANGAKKEAWTGKYEMAGFADYLFQANLTAVHEFASKKVKGEIANTWSTTVLRSSENMQELANKRYENEENVFWQVAVGMWDGMGEGGDPEYWGAE